VHCKETWFAQVPEMAEAAAAAPASASPSMWTEEQPPPTNGWGAREGTLPGTASARPVDRFAADTGEVEFALPPELQDMPDGDAPPIAPETEEPAADLAPEANPEADANAPDAMSDDEAHVPAAEHDELDYHEIRRRRGARKPVKQSKAFFTKPRAIAVLAVILFALVVMRDHVARAMPQTASLYAHLGLPVNLRGLAFEAVRASVEQQDGVSVLVIEGAVRNVARESVEVPRLRFAMRNSAGAEVYSWTSVPERPVLPPGEAQSFRTRLASPPADSKDVYVRFFQRRDIVAASQHRNEDGSHSARGR
jgi:hypothetical protein